MNWSNFEVTRKRRKGFPSETHVKRGQQIVHGNKELVEKLGRNDCAPAAQESAFKNCCLVSGRYDGSRRGHYF